jgi:tetratricopeptide (TPR) repeat protein
VVAIRQKADSLCSLRVLSSLTHSGHRDAFAERNFGDVGRAKAGHVLTDVVHEFEAGQLFIERALALNPNCAIAWQTTGWQKVYTGDPDTAIRCFGQFKRLSPLDSLVPLAMSGSAFAYFFAGRYDEAGSLAEQVLEESPNLHQALRIFIGFSRGRRTH